MYWQPELLIMIRVLINDLTATPTYTDERITQLAAVAARYVVQDANLSVDYTIDIVNETISPDPAAPTTRDETFLGLTAMKSACILDQSTFRTKAALEGLSTRLGPAALTVGGNLAGYKTLLETGPCALYDQLILDHNIGNATAVRAVLSPFVGNNFDPLYLNNLRGSGPIYGDDNRF
jgi:hypothetical protein